MKHIYTDKDKKEFENFKEKIIKEIGKRTTETTITYNKETEIIIQRAEQKQIIYLDNLWDRYVKGENLNNMLDTVLTPIFNIPPEFLEKDFNKIKDKILPKINTNFSVIDNVELVSNSNLIPMAKVYYVTDTQHSMAYLTLEEFNKFGISKEELHNTAIRNLKKLKKPKKIISHGSVYFISEDQDNYDSSRILTLNYEEIKRNLKGTIYVGIPNRDFLIVFDSNNTRLQEFFAIVDRKYKIGTYPIVPFVYSWDGTTFEPYSLREQF